MVEGGGFVINSLLQPTTALISAVNVTIAPTWLGVGGVFISPPTRTNDGGKPVAALRLDRVEWHPFGEDVVLCGKVKSKQEFLWQYLYNSLRLWCLSL